MSRVSAGPLEGRVCTTQLSGCPGAMAADRAAMERLFAVRVAAYATARVRVDAAGAAPEEVAERIIECVS